METKPLPIDDDSADVATNATPPVPLEGTGIPHPAPRTTGPHETSTLTSAETSTTGPHQSE